MKTIYFIFGCMVMLFLLNAPAVALEVGPAVPVPGFGPSKDVALTYVSSDAQFMLVQVYVPYWRIEGVYLNPNTQQWGPPVVLPTDPSPPVGFPDWTGHAILSPDGTTMYYPWDGHMCRTSKTAIGWKQPPEPVNGMDNFLYGTNSFNGTYFYGGVGHPETGPSDIWFSTCDALGQFSNGVPASSVNTSEWSEYFPWISQNSKLLLFSSNNPNLLGYQGGYDIYSAIWNENLEEWTNITNLGPNINTTKDELAPYMAEQTGMLYFERIIDDPVTGTIQLMQATPEPATLLLLTLGGLFLRKRKA